MKLVSVSIASVAVTALALSAAAAPTHVKPGLWEVNVQTGGMAAMPDMSKMPPQVRAAMAKRGVQMGAGGIVSKACITPAQAAADKPALGHAKDCQVQNAKFTGKSYSADVTCKHGEVQTRGHVAMTFESPEHYFGTIASQVAMEGRTMDSTTKIDAHWLKTDCGAVK